jgi:fructose 1,6-bisphosphate aldolase/phosphatase
MKTTLSLIKADTGSIGGHNRPSDAMVDKATEQIAKAVTGGLLTDGRVTFTGDDIALLMIHTKGVDNSDIHKLAWDTFIETTAIAKSQGLYGAGQDLLKDAFSGNVKGMGPGSSEMRSRCI